MRVFLCYICIVCIFASSDAQTSALILITIVVVKLRFEGSVESKRDKQRGKWFATRSNPRTGLRNPDRGRLEACGRCSSLLVVAFTTLTWILGWQSGPGTLAKDPHVLISRENPFSYEAKIRSSFSSSNRDTIFACYDAHEL